MLRLRLQCFNSGIFINGCTAFSANNMDEMQHETTLYNLDMFFVHKHVYCITNS